MNAELYFDTRQFDSAMRDYLHYTSKSMVDAINGKARDLAFTAAKHTRYARRVDVLDVVENPRFIIWWLNQKYGHYTKSGGTGWSSRDYLEAEREIKNRRVRSIKYMKSGYVKAGHKFPTTEASKEIAAGVLRHTGSTALATIATAEHLLSEMNITWESYRGAPPKDASEKEAIVFEALDAALALVTADIQRYIEKKQNELAKKFSA